MKTSELAIANQERQTVAMGSSMKMSAQCSVVFTKIGVRKH